MERRIGAPRTFALATLLAASALLASAATLARAQAPSPNPSPNLTASPAAAGTAPAPSFTVTPFDPSAPQGPPPQMFPGVVQTPDANATPTQPPIIVDPPSAGVTPGGTQFLRIMQVLGALTVTVADPTVADASIDQNTRILTVIGRKIGTTTVTVHDGRGLTRDVAVRVAYAAGTVGDDAYARITGRPATTEFIRETALAAALATVTSRPGASVLATAESVNVSGPLRPDDVTTVDVPIIVQGGDQYFTVSKTTHVRIENFAQPAVRPKQLLVSDFPETLKESGTLFSADLTTKTAERFLYYHYNPAGQPDRRIVLHVSNTSPQPALLQFIAGTAGPGLNEMEVGHLSTQRFLVHLAQDEGSVVTVPGNSNMALLVQGLPAKTVVSGLLQLHEISGAPLHLKLVAQDAADSIDAVGNGALLEGDHPHARGIYPIPEFFFDYRYDAEGPELTISIGQLPLPNIVQGQTLAGDYGVLQSVTIRMINNDRHHARDIALYADPRGGRATGTFVIDRVLVQAHAMAPFAHYKLRQYTLPPGSFVRTEIVTMPEGGSSYPLQLIVAPDDGSPSPGAPDSPIY